MKVIWCLALLAITWRSVSGHGKLIDPPSRASAWRYGFNTPANHNDNELYCGGLFHQWNKNGGKCGVCGDPWDAPTPRNHELGGKYGVGVIVREYAPQETIVIRVDLSANHKGYFEFRVCENPKDNKQACFDKNVLKLDGKDETKFYPTDGNKVYEMRYRLPKGLKCSHCVMQWRYIAGNNPGHQQEEFRACADIAISGSYNTSNGRPNPPANIPQNHPNAIPNWGPKVSTPKVPTVVKVTTRRPSPAANIPRNHPNAIPNWGPKVSAPKVPTVVKVTTRRPSPAANIPRNHPNAIPNWGPKVSAPKVPTVVKVTDMRPSPPANIPQNHPNAIPNWRPKVSTSKVFNAGSWNDISYPSANSLK